MAEARHPHVALALRFMDALTRQDLDEMNALSAADVEHYSFFAGLGAGGVYRGQEGTERWMADLDEAWEDIRAEVDATLAIEDIVLLVGRIHYRGKSSQIETEAESGWVLKFREGKVVTYRAFRDPARALESVGADA